MGKNRPQPMRNKEATIEQKEKAYTRQCIYSDIFLTVVCLYYTFSVCAYMSENPKAGFAESMASVWNEIMKNPLYLFPINYDVILALGTTVVVVLLVFVVQTYQFMRLHHNVNTLKGKTHWAEFDDILERYGDYTDTKGGK